MTFLVPLCAHQPKPRSGVFKKNRYKKKHRNQFSKRIHIKKTPKETPRRILEFRFSGISFFSKSSLMSKKGGNPHKNRYLGLLLYYFGRISLYLSLKSAKRCFAGSDDQRFPLGHTRYKLICP